MQLHGEEGHYARHRVSRKGLEVEKVKIEVIEKLPPHNSVRGVKSYLGHACFYRRFIKKISHITKPLCALLEKDVPFCFDESYLNVFQVLKDKLVSAPVIISPDWSLPFELMCDVSDYVIGMVLGQQMEKVFHTIYYASKATNWCSSELH